MYLDISYIIEPLIEEKNYIVRLFKRRNDFSNQAMVTKISSILSSNLLDKTPLDLFYHGLSPLNVNCQVIQKIHNKEIDIGLTRLNCDNKIEECIELMDQVIQSGKNSLVHVPINQLIGNLRSLRRRPDKLRKRFTKLVQHSIHHLGQAIVFQGLICKSLKIKKGR